MFRPSDERRVQALFDVELPPPYEATISLRDERRELWVTVTDPDDSTRTVVMCAWVYDERRKLEKQPSEAELSEKAARFVEICNAYPFYKAAEAAEQAERQARQAANLEARRVDAEERAAAEARLKSAMASALAAKTLTGDKIAAVEQAAASPALD